MKVVLGSDNDASTAAICEVMNACASGCQVVQACGLDRLAEAVVQHRPDLAIVSFIGGPEEALAAINEARESYSVTVLAVGPTSDAKLILRALNQGVQTYVDVEALEPELVAALRRVSIDRPGAKLSGRVIVVVGAGGGCGATTLAANIGASLAKRGKPCCLIDLDLTAGDLASTLGAARSHSIADFTRHINRMDATLLDTCLAKCGENLEVMPAPTDYRDISAVTPRGVRKAINMVRARDAYVVIDAPMTYRPEQDQAFFASDKIVLTVRADFTSVRTASRLLAYLEDLDVSKKRVCLVVNRRVSGLGLRDSDIAASLQMPVHFTIPEHSRHMSGAVNRGVPLVVDRPRSPVSYRLAEIASSVNGAVDHHSGKDAKN